MSGNKTLTATFKMKDDITGKLSKAINSMQKFKQQTEKVTKGVKDLDNQKMGKFSGNLQKVNQNMNALADNSSLGKLTNALGRAKNRISDIFKESNSLKEFGQNMKKEFDAVRKRIADSVADMVRTSANGIKRISQSFARSGIAQAGAKMVESIQNLGRNIGRGISKIGDSAVRGFKGIADRIPQPIKNMANRIAGTFTNMATRIHATVAGIGSRTVGGFARLGSGIRNALSTTSRGVIGILSQMARGAHNIVGQMAGSMGRSLSRAFHGVTGAVSRVANDVGRGVGVIGRTLGRLVSVASQTMAKVAGAIARSPIGRAMGSVANTVSRAGSAMGRGMARAFNGMVAVTTRTGQAIGRGVRGISRTIGSAGRGAINAGSAMSRGLGRAFLDVVGSSIKAGQLVGRGVAGIASAVSRGTGRIRNGIQSTLGGIFNRLNLGRFTPQLNRAYQGFRGFFSRVGNGFKNFTRSAQNGLRNVLTLGRGGSQGMESLTGSIFKSQLAMQALNTVTTTVMNGITGAIERVDAIRSSTRSIEVLTGSGEEARKVMEEVTEVIQGTPIALNQVTNATKGLVASGMDAREVPGVIEAIGNASFGVANGIESIDQITGAFKGLQSSGTATLEDLNRLVDANVPAVKILANQYGLSVADMRRKLSAGAISSEDAISRLVEGMEKGTDGVAGKTAGLAGQMQTAGDTIRGAMANIRTAIVRAFTAPLDMYYEQIVEFLKGVRNHIGEFANIMTAGFERIIPIIVSVFQQVWPKVQEFGNRLKTFLIPVIDLLVQTFWGLSEQIGPVFSTIAGYFSSLMNTLGPIVQMIAEAWGRFIARILSIVPAVMSMVGLVIPLFEKLTQAIGPLIVTIMDGLGQAIVSLIGYAQKYWPQFANIISWAVDTIMPVIQKVIDIVMVLVNNVIIPLIPVAWNMFIQLWEKVQPVLSNFFGLVSDVADLVMTLVNGVIVPNLPHIVSAFDTMWKGISPIINFVMDALNDLIGAFSTVVDWGSRVADVVGGTISRAGNWISENITNRGNTGGQRGGARGRSHASGLDRVPYDGYQATLHRNERVLTSAETKDYERGGKSGQTRDVTVNLGGVTITNGQDAEEIARIIAQRIIDLT